jgi:hypothetical protein
MKVNFNDEVNWNHFVEVVAPSLPMRHIRDATLELIENKQYALIVAIEFCYNDDPDNMKDHGELSHINFVNIYGEKYEGPLEILVNGKWIDGEFE